MIQKVNSKMIRQMHFMYMGKFFFHLDIGIQKSREKIWITFGDTIVSGMGQPVLHGFRGLHGFTGSGRGRPSIYSHRESNIAPCERLQCPQAVLHLLECESETILFKNLFLKTECMGKTHTYVRTLAIEPQGGEFREFREYTILSNWWYIQYSSANTLYINTDLTTPA